MPTLQNRSDSLSFWISNRRTMSLCLAMSWTHCIDVECHPVSNISSTLSCSNTDRFTSSLMENCLHPSIETVGCHQALRSLPSSSICLWILWSIDSIKPRPTFCPVVYSSLMTVYSSLIHYNMHV